MNPGLNGQNSANSSASASPTASLHSNRLNHNILPASSQQGSPSDIEAQQQNPASGKSKFRPFTPPKTARKNDFDVAGEDKGAPKRIACIECRQQKVRCDAHELYPDPCTRCVKKKLKCLVQPDFKRTYKRRRLVEVEQEIERLKHSIETQENAKRWIVSGSLLDLSASSHNNYSIPLAAPKEPEKASTPQYHDLPAPMTVREKLPNAETPSSIDGGGSSSSTHFRHRPGAATVSGHVDLDPAILECTEKTMERVTLRPETIANLYKEYVTKYHPFLPVVDVSKGPEKIYELCPALFWTIMAIASRRYDKDGELMMDLTPILKICLSEITISPINRFVANSSNSPVLNVASAYSVQAFLIYTMWPSITSTLSADSSWSTAGIAMYSGIRVGLHCPGYARDFGRIKTDNPIYPKISEQIRTWICCNIVSQTVATVYGFPAFTSFDASVLSACENDSGIDVPLPIKQLMQIQHLEEEIAKTLNSNPKDPLGLSELSERLSLIQILSRKMDELEMRLGPDLDDCRKFVMLGARVHLLTYYFLDNGGYSETQLQKGMVHAYNSALALMEHAERAYQRDRSFFRYMPGIYAQILWQSSSIICKIFHSPFAQFVDSNAGRQMYMSCVSLISKASILKHDMMYRAAEIMQQAWRLFGAIARRNLGLSSSRIVIRTRMSASVFFDLLWTMREEIGIRSVAPAVLDQRNPADADDDDDIDTHSTEGTPVSTSVKTPVLGPAQPFRYKDDDTLTETQAQVHATLNTLPYDPSPIIAGAANPTKVTRPATRGRGRGRVRGGKKQQIPLRTKAGVASNAPGDKNIFAPMTPSISNLILPPIVELQDEPQLNASTIPEGSESFLGAGLPVMDGPGPAAAGGLDQAQPSQQDSVLNGVDFFSWEADNIWRDVDMLMNDFGFGEDEAPTLDAMLGGATTPAGTNVDGEMTQNAAKADAKFY